MPRIINHEERKERILYEALNIFNEIGIKDSSLALIAKRSAISRPILYSYFNDKNDIFYYAIKIFTDKMQLGYQKIATNASLTFSLRLKLIFITLLNEMQREKALMGALVNYYFELRGCGKALLFEQVIEHRTIKFKRMLHHLLRLGEKNNEFIEGATSKTEFIFMLSKGLFLQLALLNDNNKQNLLTLIDISLDSLKK
jgi:AcrR family transcriptional regulator